MPTLQCPSCGYWERVPKSVSKFGMLCPECHLRNLKPWRQENPANRTVTVRSGTVRALIAGGVMSVLGLVLLVAGLASWNAGRFGARMIGWGGVLVILGLTSLVTGIVGLRRDLK